MFYLRLLCHCEASFSQFRKKKRLLFNNNCSCNTCKTVNVACRNPMQKQIKLLRSAMPRQTCNIRVVGMKNVSDICVLWCVWPYSFGGKKGINMIMVLSWWIHILNFYSNSLWLHELVPGTQYSLIVQLNLFLAVVLKCRLFNFFHPRLLNYVCCILNNNSNLFL